MVEGLSRSLSVSSVRHLAELFQQRGELDLDRMDLAVTPILDDERAVLDLPEDHCPVAVAAYVQEVRHYLLSIAFSRASIA